MTTIGTKIKDLRKNKGYSQSELAERLGISLQTLSRWECDRGMPDIIGIVPLAKELGTTTDFLLGMETSESEDVSEYVNDFSNSFDETSWNNAVGDRKFEDVLLEKFYEGRNLAKRYPSNYDLLLQCSEFGIEVLEMAKKHHRLELSEDEAEEIMGDIERMTGNVISNDKRLNAKSYAIHLYAKLLCYKGLFDIAYSECNGMDIRQNLLTKIEIAGIQNTEESKKQRIEYSKSLYQIFTHDMYSALRTLGRAYSVYGKPMRDKAIEVYNTTLDLILPTEKTINCVGYATRLIDIYMLLSKEYLRDGDIEGCIDYIEKICDTVLTLSDTLNGSSDESHFKDAFIDEKNGRGGRVGDKIMAYIVACWEECGSSDNPVTRHERYKKCIERLESAGISTDFNK